MFWELQATLLEVVSAYLLDFMEVYGHEALAIAAAALLLDRLLAG